MEAAQWRLRRRCRRRCRRRRRRRHFRRFGAGQLCQGDSWYVIVAAADATIRFDGAESKECRVGGGGGGGAGGGGGGGGAAPPQAAPQQRVQAKFDYAAVR